MRAAGTREIPTHVRRVQGSMASGDADAGMARWTASVTSQRTNASMRTKNARFAAPFGFTPRTYTARNALTPRARRESPTPRDVRLPRGPRPRHSETISNVFPSTRRG